LREVLAASAIEGKDEVLRTLARNYENYVMNVDAPPVLAAAAPRLV
jgi:hypothetical protein